jgi:DNA-binding response OmpR family regulator
MTTKILLADDSVTIQKVVELTFSDKNYKVTTVGDGESALRKAREARPDIILLDVIMPGMDGYEVCSVLKQDPDLKDVPVLLLTGTFEVFDTEKSQRVHADGYITKPFESQELIARVRRLVSQNRPAAGEDLESDLVLPELEKEEPLDSTSRTRSGLDEEFPEFTFDAQASELDGEVLFDFSTDTPVMQTPAKEERASAARGAKAQGGQGVAFERARGAPPKRASKTSGDEPQFDLPELGFEGGEGAAAQQGGGQSFWDLEEDEMSSNLSAIQAPGVKKSPSGRQPDAGQFVFEETTLLKSREIQDRAPAPDLGPLLERIAKLEALVQQQAAVGVVEPKPEDVEKALQKMMPEILDRVADTISARLPELIDRAAEKLGARVAEQFAQKLQEGGFDSREIVTSIAWHVVPDVAEMIVRRELEEIRRNI